VPRIRDTEALLVLLEDLGVVVGRRAQHRRARRRRGEQDDVDAALAERIRASFLVAGPLLPASARGAAAARAAT
jgi:UDP-N-acetylglucosamine 1-carboxyvinyltransferase